MNRIVNLFFGFFLCCVHSHLFSFSRVIKVVNHTHMTNPLAVVTLDKPFNRSDVSRLSMMVLHNYAETFIRVNGPILGWHMSGMPAEYTIIDPSDTIIVFVEHEGKIKTLHSAPRELKITNEKNYDLIFRTKNPHTGNIDCGDCALDCYDSRGSTGYCSCLAFCWDRTRDMEWRLVPGRTKNIEVASGTDIGIYKVSDDNCYDGFCGGKRITTTTTTYYWP